MYRIAAILAVALAATLPGVARADTPVWLQAFGDRWRGASTVDAITDEPVFRIYLVTASVNERIGLNLARLTLTCTGGKPKMRVEWDFKSAGPAHLSLSYRFGTLPGRAMKVRYVNRSEQEVTDKTDLRRFLTDAALAKTLAVRVESDLYGTSTAVFRAGAGADAAARFAAACPEVAAR
jgi:hypothetical protein